MRVILYVYAYRYVARIKSGDFEISRGKITRKIGINTHGQKRKKNDGNMHRRMLRPARIARAVPFALFIQVREETHALDLVLLPVRGTRFPVRSREQVRASVGSREEEETRARATTRERRRERGRGDEGECDEEVES